VSGSEQLQRLAYPLPYLVFIHSEAARGEGHVLLDGRGEERGLGELEDEAHPAAQLAPPERPRIHAVHEDAAARRLEEQVQVLDERALPRARPADYAEHLVRLDRERDAPQRLDLEWGPRRVDVPHVLELDPHRNPNDGVPKMRRPGTRSTVIPVTSAEGSPRDPPVSVPSPGRARAPPRAAR
jgi:hypothetical protein